MVSVRLVLKIYSLFVGCVVSFMSFLWVAFELYVVSQTPPDQTDLLMARYLDISFGLLAFSSSLALMYGAFVESKTWLSVWTLGSATVLVGCWVWFFYRKYFNDHPESMVEAQTAGIALTFTYLGTSFPVWIYYRHYLDDAWSFFSKPWCSSGVGDHGERRGARSSNFLTIPSSFCSFGNMANFTAENSARSGRCYVAVSDGATRVSVPKEEDLYNPV